MFTANYHTHTKRCGHATGEDEEYVQEAIGQGYSDLGFSDHIMLPGFVEPYVRGDFSLFEDYCSSIRDLSDRYSEQIQIYLGFEAEAFRPYFPFYKELIGNGVIDYLILGNHSAMDDSHELICKFGNITSVSQLYLYRDLALEAIQSGMFQIFAHPDYFMMSIENFDSDCKKVSKSLIEACMAYDVPLEINLSGIRMGEKQFLSKRRLRYPTDEFFELVGKYGAKCIFGADAHKPDQLSMESVNYLGVQFAKKHNLNVIDRLDTIRRH